jgi:hypothetical protein
MYPDGIQTRNPSKRVAADLRLRPRRHWHRHLPYNWQEISADLTAYLHNKYASYVTGNMARSLKKKLLAPSGTFDCYLPILITVYSRI